MASEADYRQAMLRLMRHPHMPLNRERWREFTDAFEQWLEAAFPAGKASEKSGAPAEEAAAEGPGESG